MQQERMGRKHMAICYKPELCLHEKTQPVIWPCDVLLDRIYRTYAQEQSITKRTKEEIHLQAPFHLLSPTGQIYPWWLTPPLPGWVIWSFWQREINPMLCSHGMIFCAGLFYRQLGYARNYVFQNPHCMLTGLLFVWMEKTEAAWEVSFISATVKQQPLNGKSSLVRCRKRQMSGSRRVLVCSHSSLPYVLLGQITVTTVRLTLHLLTEVGGHRERPPLSVDLLYQPSVWSHDGSWMCLAFRFPPKLGGGQIWCCFWIWAHIFPPISAMLHKSHTYCWNFSYQEYCHQELLCEI